MQQPSKKTKLKNLRNVLQSPFAIKWSEKTADEVSPIQNLLKEVLPSAKLEETEQRIKYNKRKEVSRKDVPEKRSSNVNRTYLAIGFNHVIRSLERGELCCVLVSSDIQPPLLTKTLLTHVLGKGRWGGGGSGAVPGVPVLILPDLRVISRCALGYAAMTIGLKNVAVNPDNIFNPVYKLVSLNPTILETQQLTTRTEEEEEESPVKLQPTGIKDESKAPKLLDFKPENVYLYRKNTTERAFNPEVRGVIDVKTSAKEMEGIDFVSLGGPASRKKTSDFLAFDDKPADRVCSEYKQEKSLPVDRMEDDDDDDDDDSDEEEADNIFFVDNKRDDSLIKSYRKNLQYQAVNIAKTDNVHKKPHKLQQQGISRMFQTNKISDDQTNDQRKKGKNKLKNKFKVNYLPLKLKTITGNIKRVHRKSKS